MLTPDEFPYITAIHVNDCYAYQDFDIKLNDDKPFSHLVLTGKNGSGKSTILRMIDDWQTAYSEKINMSVLHSLALLPPEIEKVDYSRLLSHKDFQVFLDLVTRKPEIIDISRLLSLKDLPIYVDFFTQKPEILNIRLHYTHLQPLAVLIDKNYTYIRSVFKADRNNKLSQTVTTVVKDTVLINDLKKNNTPNFFISQFKQYLVNKKIGQAFDILDNKQPKISQTDLFFEILINSFKNILEDPELELVFVRENFDFYIQLSNGRQIAFENLSDGFSALISVLMDLFLSVDVIRKEVKDFGYNPCGIVLIDEPETHLHLKLQEEVMPLLTGLFPNIQFIVATHSPAVMASIKNATIFDLTTKTTENDRIVGSSYSELMVSHFGLDNEYSSFADGIFKEINAALRLENESERHDKLQSVLAQNERYLSPAMRLELESMILDNQ